MTKNKDSKKDAESNKLKQAEEKKAELVNFVANNILNNITLNQVVTLVQQVAIRDANQVIDDADDEKLKEIEAALEAAKQPAAKQPADQASAADPEDADS